MRHCLLWDCSPILLHPTGRQLSLPFALTAKHFGREDVTSHLGCCEVTVARGGSSPQFLTPPAAIPVTLLPSMVLRNSCFCPNWSEEALLAACHRFPSLLPGSANPSIISGAARWTSCIPACALCSTAPLAGSPCFPAGLGISFLGGLTVLDAQNSESFRAPRKQEVPTPPALPSWDWVTGRHQQHLPTSADLQHRPPPPSFPGPAAHR